MTLARTYEIKKTIPFPFTIKCLSSFPIDESPLRENQIHIIVGFIPGFIENVQSLGADLASVVHQNVEFRDFNLLEPRFHCGIEWVPSVLPSDTSSESEAIEPLYDSDDEMISGSPVFPKYFS